MSGSFVVRHMHTEKILNRNIPIIQLAKFEAVTVCLVDVSIFRIKL